MEREHQNDSSMPLPEAVLAARPFNALTLLGASLVFAIALFALYFVSRRKTAMKGNVVLLIGASDAGKTAILSTLVYEKTLPSHASLQVNSSMLSITETKALRIVDVPGHPRVRDQYQDFMSEAKGIVFVVDAATISRNGASVAEHLHKVLHSLTSLPPSQASPALLILAHKYDNLKASAATVSPAQLAIQRVRTILERELEKRRASHSGGVGVEGLGSDAGSGEGELGGLDMTSQAAGGAFRFSDWEGGEVTFAATTTAVKSSEVSEEKGSSIDGLADLVEWLGSL